MKLNVSILLLGALASTQSFAYESSYQRLSWSQRAADNFYCLDILDANGNPYEELRALACGDNLYEFSPENYVMQTYGTNLPDGFVFGWRIWSASGYGGNGFEGVVTVGGSNCPSQSYQSNADNLQWTCRAQDSYYCVDVFDAQGAVVQAPAACGEGLHNFNPNTANLAAGDYQWKVWSPAGYAGQGFEGTFTVANLGLARGTDLYSINCAACHGVNPARGYNGIDRAIDANNTRNAINSNKGGMSYLGFLTDSELSDIATYIRTARGL
jgi:hypothetical protein